MEYSLLSVLKVMAEGAPLSGLVFALVYYLGEAGIKGKAQFWASFVIGAAIGAGFVIAQLGLPVSFAGWFYFSLHVLVAGIAPSGVDKGIKHASRKGVVSAVVNPPTVDEVKAVINSADLKKESG